MPAEGFLPGRNPGSGGYILDRWFPDLSAKGVGCIKLHYSSVSDHGVGSAGWGVCQ